MEGIKHFLTHRCPSGSDGNDHPPFKARLEVLLLPAGEMDWTQFVIRDDFYISTGLQWKVLLLMHEGKIALLKGNLLSLWVCWLKRDDKCDLVVYEAGLTASGAVFLRGSWLLLILRSYIVAIWMFFSRSLPSFPNYALTPWPRPALASPFERQSPPPSSLSLIIQNKNPWKRFSSITSCQINPLDLWQTPNGTVDFSRLSPSSVWFIFAEMADVFSSRVCGQSRGGCHPGSASSFVYSSKCCYLTSKALLFYSSSPSLILSSVFRSSLSASALWLPVCLPFSSIADYSPPIACVRLLFPLSFWSTYLHPCVVSLLSSHVSTQLLISNNWNWRVGSSHQVSASAAGKLEISGCCWFVFQQLSI